MSKSNRKRREAAGGIDLTAVDLREVSPVTRMRAVAANLLDTAISSQNRTKRWMEKSQNPKLTLVHSILGDICKLGTELGQKLLELEKEGFTPPRKSFTALLEEGDHVSVLDIHRERYQDVLDPKLMGDLVVYKKRKGLHGFLVLEGPGKQRLHVASSHVAKISKAA